MLLNHTTCFIIKTTGYTERSLLTTTSYRNIVVLTKTKLCNGILPISIIVILLILRECWVIVDFWNISSTILLFRIKVSLLEQHCIVVTTQQFISLRLICTCETQRVRDAWRTALTSFCFDFNNTICTLRTIYCSSSGILQYCQLLNILWVDVQKLSKLFIVGTTHIKVAHIHIPCVTIHDDKRIRIGKSTDR